MGDVRAYPFGTAEALAIDPMYSWLQEHEPLARVNCPTAMRVGC